jgi:hypothetical protein
MTSRLTASLRSILAPVPRRETTHFHLGHDGRAFVCDFHRCDSPALSLGEVAPGGRQAGR